MMMLANSVWCCVPCVYALYDLCHLFGFSVSDSFVGPLVKR